MLVDQLKEHLERNYRDKIFPLEIAHGDLTGYINPDGLVELFRQLRLDPDLQLNFLSMITASDYPGIREKRFEIVYSIYSLLQHHRLLLKLRINENEQVPSLTSVWDTANWQEREVYDMFGIVFTGHPELTRILMDDDWVGYPQRKDFPLTYEAPEFSHNRDKITLDDKTPGRELF